MIDKADCELFEYFHSNCVSNVWEEMESSVITNSAKGIIRIIETVLRIKSCIAVIMTNLIYSLF